MKTYEGSFTIKWYPNDAGDKRPLTIDTESKDALDTELKRIRMAFIDEGEMEIFHNMSRIRKAHSVAFDLTERK